MALIISVNLLHLKIVAVWHMSNYSCSIKILDFVHFCLVTLLLVYLSRLYLLSWYSSSVPSLLLNFFVLFCLVLIFLLASHFQVV